MAEILGIVASVLTLCQAVIEGVSRVAELYRAPAEIKTLQEQIQSFQAVIQSVEATSEVSVQGVLYGELSRARRIIEGLHQVINVTLVRQEGGSGRVRRRVWLRNKQNVGRLRDNLEDVRKALLEALSAEVLSSTRRVESTLTIISQQSTTNNSTAVSINQRLENIENALDPWRSAQATQLALQTGSNSATVHPESRGAAPCLVMPSMRKFSHFLQSSTSNDTDTATVRGKDTSALWLPPTQAQSMNIQLAQRAAPASPFEMSASFLPEIYTVLSATPTLVSYYNREVDAAEYTRVNQCAMLYSKTPRQWTRLTVSITTSVESIYWNIEKMKCADLNPKNTHQLPVPLTLALETFLRSCQNVNEDSHLSLFLGSRSDLKKNKKASELSIRFIEPHFQAKRYLHQITSMVYHWNCPRYSERELIQRPLHRNRPGNLFIAYLQSRWVLEFRFGSEKKSIDSLLYVLQVLHCLQDAPGISPLIGVVLDDSNIINAFLCEIPANGRLFGIINKANKSGQPVTWKRRKKWCRQIVHNIAELHSKAFVAGFLANVPDCGVAVDGNDNAVLYSRFRTTFPYYGNNRPGVLPPENRQSAVVGDSITATPYSDIYQLGLLLWEIAANNTFLLCSDFCEIAGCATKADTVCTKSHVDPVQLPSPGDHTPQYLREIIAACRSENPHERLPAWKLLEMFPAMAEDNTSLKDAVDDGGGTIRLFDHQDVSIDRETVNDHASAQIFTRTGPPSECTPDCLARLEECFEKYENPIHCDICGESTDEHYFHCKVCHLADYDRCFHCFSQGAHCLERDHYLIEYSEWKQVGRYHTSVRETGQRDVITLECSRLVDEN